MQKKKKKRALKALATSMQAMDSEHPKDGQELQDFKEEVARLRAEVDKRRREAHEEIRRRTSDLSMLEKEEVMKQCTEWKKSIKKLDTREAETALESRELSRCREELEKQLRKLCKMDSFGRLEGLKVLDALLKRN